MMCWEPQTRSPPAYEGGVCLPLLRTGQPGTERQSLWPDHRLLGAQTICHQLSLQEGLRRPHATMARPRWSPGPFLMA